MKLIKERLECFSFRNNKGKVVGFYRDAATKDYNINGGSVGYSKQYIRKKFYI